MATKQFYLLGESPSSTRDVEIPSQTDYEDLLYLVASTFAIVDPHGVGFLSNDDVLTTVADVVSSKGAVAISIDGKAVRDIPGPGGLPYVGNFFEIYPDHLGNHQRLFKTYGPIIKTKNFGNVVYSTIDPKLATIAFAESDFFSKRIVKEHPLFPIKVPEAGIFLGDTDTEEWRTTHKFLPPALGPKAVRRYTPTMQRVVEESFKVFDELDGGDEAWNVYGYMLKLASQSIGKLMLGMDFDHFSSVDAPLHIMIMCIGAVLELNKLIVTSGPFLSKLPFGPEWKLNKVAARIRSMLEETARNAAVGGTEDLELQEAAMKAENLVDYVLRATDNKGNKLPKEKLLEPLVVITSAGFTTTASLISWIFYVLVTESGLQERLLQELIDHGIDEDTQLDLDTLNKLEFLDNLVKETQRRNNPSYQPARTSKVDMILPGGYKFPKDSVLIAAIHHIHNSPDLWENPTRFDPDRWNTEKVKNRPAGTYTPFAAGPRACIGFNIALAETKLFIVKLIYRYNFTLASDGPIEYDPLFQLVTPNNLFVRAERRVKWPPRTDA